MASPGLNVVLTATGTKLDNELKRAQAKLSEFEAHVQKTGKGAGGAFDDLDNKAKKAGDSIAGIGSKIALGMAVVTGALVAGAAGMTKLAMDAVESDDMFTRSMGEMADAGRAWSETMRDAYGLNAVEVRKSVGTFAMMFGSMGLTKDAAYDLSTSLTKLSYDWGSLANRTPAEMFAKVRSGLMGEMEPLKELGITLDETTVKTWAVNAGLAKQTDELTAAQKVLARYGSLMEQSALANNNLGETLESPANQLRIFQQRLEAIATSIGASFLPAVGGALIWLNDEGLPRVTIAIDKMRDAWGEMSDEARGRIIAVAGLMIAGGPLITGIGMAISAVGMLAKAFGVLPVQARIAIVGVGVSLLLFRQQIGDMIEGVGTLIRNAGQAAQKIPGVAGSELAFNLMSMGMGIREAGIGLKEWAPTVEGAVGAIEDAALPAIDALTASVGKLGADAKKSFEDWTASDKLEEARIRAKAAREELEKMPDPMARIRAEWNNTSPLGKGIQDGAKAIKDSLRDLEYVGRDHLKGLEDASKRSLEGMATASKELRGEIDKAEAALKRFSSVRFAGQDASDEKIFQLEQQQAQARLGELGKRFGEKGLTESERIGLQIEQERLQAQIKWAPGQRQIQQAMTTATGDQPLTFKTPEEALASFFGNLGRLNELKTQDTILQENTEYFKNRFEQDVANMKGWLEAINRAQADGKDISPAVMQDLRDGLEGLMGLNVPGPEATTGPMAEAMATAAAAWNNSPEIQIDPGGQMWGPGVTDNPAVSSDGFMPASSSQNSYDQRQQTINVNGGGDPTDVMDAFAGDERVMNEMRPLNSW
jgi:hypothetical protein